METLFGSTAAADMRELSLSETLAAIDNDKTAVLQYVSQNGTSAPPAILTYSLKGRAK